MSKLIIGIGDLHLPFHDEAVCRWIVQYIGKNASRIHAIVQLGDLYDMMSYSKFAKRLYCAPSTEIRRARWLAQEFWLAIRRYAPNAELYQIKGNHDERLIKRVIEKMPEIEYFMDYEHLWNFPEVTTIQNPREPLKIWDWNFIHGHVKNGDHCRAVDFQNVACGHTHTGGTWHKRVNTMGNVKMVTELNCGYAANPFHEALIYRPLKKYFGWTPGFGEIEQDVAARFVPFGGYLK